MILYFIGNMLGKSIESIELEWMEYAQAHLSIMFREAFNHPIISVKKRIQENKRLNINFLPNRIDDKTIISILS